MTLQNINALPVLTWHRLNINDTSVTVSGERDELKINVTAENAVINNTPSYNGVTALGKSTDHLFDSGISIKLADKKTDYAVLEINDGKEKLSSALIEINVGAGARLTITQKIETTFQSALRTSITAKEKAKLHLIQIISGGGSTLNDVGITALEHAEIKLTRIYLSSGEIYTGTRAELTGRGARLLNSSAYVTRGRLDMNIIADHIGENTVSKITADGTVYEGAEKIFRGTIDLKRGAKGADGQESENVLLLGDHVVNKSIPLILCTEEDVSGQHGATIGEMSEDMLYYLGSRGIDKTMAEQMMARANIEKLADTLDEKNAEYVKKRLEEVI